MRTSRKTFARFAQTAVYNFGWDEESKPRRMRKSLGTIDAYSVYHASIHMQGSTAVVQYIACTVQV